ncbi:MAG: ATP-binding protein [Pseudomonadota bacterium]|nr:ATP-binding protein [Pseudomonadota bacterium]
MNRKFFNKKLLITLFFLLTAISLFLSINALMESSKISQYNDLLFLSNFSCVAILIGLIFKEMRDLLKKAKKRVAGSRITLKIVLTFIVLSILPLTTIYAFSIYFINKSIESWFKVEISNSLENSVALSRESLDLNLKKLLRDTKLMVSELRPNKKGQERIDLRSLRDPSNFISSNKNLIRTENLQVLLKKSDAEEIAVLDEKGGVIASINKLGNLIPSVPIESLLLQLNNSQEYITLEPTTTDQLFARVALKFKNGQSENILHVLYRLPSIVNFLALTVEEGIAKYNELAYLRTKLRLSFTLTLTLVLLFSVIGSIWAAIFLSRLLTKPIADLTQGTKTIAAGNYATEIERQSNDDLGALVMSFNEMTRQIAASTEKIKSQRNYLNVLMRQLSSGLLSISETGICLSVNSAIFNILGVKENEVINKHINAVEFSQNSITELFTKIYNSTNSGETQWQFTTSISNGNWKKEILCRGIRIKAFEEHRAAHLVNIEDITIILQAQKEAAWSEVARRLAHEIKNPLTPIKLSAERMNIKYGMSLLKPEQEKFSKLTNTIIQQVDIIKDMVDEFSGYAGNASREKKQKLNLDQLIKNVIELFSDIEDVNRIQFYSSSSKKQVFGCNASLSRMLTNLITNALEASDKKNKKKVDILSKSIISNKNKRHIIIIKDYGNGISNKMMYKIFDPYVTTKSQGRGLGLPIVKKIVEDHNGSIKLRSDKRKGTRVFVVLPQELKSAAI